MPTARPAEPEPGHLETESRRPFLPSGKNRTSEKSFRVSYFQFFPPRTLSQPLALTYRPTSSCQAPHYQTASSRRQDGLVLQTTQNSAASKPGRSASRHDERQASGHRTAALRPGRRKASRDSDPACKGSDPACEGTEIHAGEQPLSAWPPATGTSPGGKGCPIWNRPHTFFLCIFALSKGKERLQQSGHAGAFPR